LRSNSKSNKEKEKDYQTNINNNGEKKTNNEVKNPADLNSNKQYANVPSLTTKIVYANQTEIKQSENNEVDIQEKIEKEREKSAYANVPKELSESKKVVYANHNDVLNS